MILALCLVCLGQATYVATTDETGYARLAVSPGTYTITAVVPEGLYAQERIIEVGPDGWAGNIVVRPDYNVWAKVIHMSGSEPDTPIYVGYWCNARGCGHQVLAVAEARDRGPPDLPCPFCGGTVPYIRGNYAGSGSDPVEFLEANVILIEEGP